MGLAGWMEQNPALQTHSKSDIGWMATDVQFEKLMPLTRNVTATFGSLYQTTSLSDLKPRGAENLIFLFVPGLFTRWYPGYMSHNVREFRKLGLSAELASLNTDVGVLSNAKALKEQVVSLAAEAKRRVVLLCHSKGSLDAAAMLAVFPETRPLVAALLAAQGTLQLLYQHRSLS